MKTQETFKKLPQLFQHLALSACEDKTVDRAPEEGRKRGKSGPLMSKTFFVKREGLTLKYSGWQ